MKPTMRVETYAIKHPRQRFKWLATLDTDTGDTPLCEMESGDVSWERCEDALAHARFVADRCGFDFVNADAEGGER